MEFIMSLFFMEFIMSLFLWSLSCHSFFYEVYHVTLFFVQVLQGDRRLGLRHGNTGQGPGSAALDEPMDTIFVKNVRENSSADVAGLATGKLLFCFLIWYLICPHKLAEYNFCSLKSISFPFYICIFKFS